MIVKTLVLHGNYIFNVPQVIFVIKFSSTTFGWKLFQSLEVSERKWEYVRLNSLLVWWALHKCMMQSLYVLSKLAQFMVASTIVTVEEMEWLFRDFVYKIRGIPFKTTDDWDLRFSNRVWQVFHYLLKTQLAMSTSFHSQIDGQINVE